MKRTRTTTAARSEEPQEIIRRLLQAPLTPMYPAVVERRVAALERRAPDVVAEARRAGVDAQYLGITELFESPRLYEGVDTDWVLAPAQKAADAVMPAAVRRDLRRLVEQGIEFPFTYIAHEVRKEHAQARFPARQAGPQILDVVDAEELVGPVPPHAGAVALGERLGQRSAQLVRAARRAAVATGVAAAGLAAAPVVLVGGAIASLATLDPIVLGAVPALHATPGQPAAFYVLARWDW
jgi:hypothetical protein